MRGKKRTSAKGTYSFRWYVRVIPKGEGAWRCFVIVDDLWLAVRVAQELENMAAFDAADVMSQTAILSRFGAETLGAYELEAAGAWTVGEQRSALDAARSRLPSSIGQVQVLVRQVEAIVSEVERAVVDSDESDTQAMAGLLGLHPRQIEKIRDAADPANYRGTKRPKPALCYRFEA